MTLPPDPLPSLGRRAALLALLLLCAAPLAGCGKKGSPQPPPGEPNVYPRTYPAQ